MENERRSPKGRGSHIDPPNRFASVHTEADWEQVEGDEEFLAAADHPATEYFVSLQHQSLPRLRAWLFVLLRSTNA
jgi:hypothetical protein